MIDQQILNELVALNKKAEQVINQLGSLTALLNALLDKQLATKISGEYEVKIVRPRPQAPPKKPH